MRLLTAGLMMGSGLGVVVPEGFMAFAEGAEQVCINSQISKECLRRGIGGFGLHADMVHMNVGRVPHTVMPYENAGAGMAR